MTATRDDDAAFHGEFLVAEFDLLNRAVGIDHHLAMSATLV